MPTEIYRRSAWYTPKIYLWHTQGITEISLIYAWDSVKVPKIYVSEWVSVAVSGTLYFFFILGKFVLKTKMLEMSIYFCLTDLFFGLNKIFSLNLVKKLHIRFKRIIQLKSWIWFLIKRNIKINKTWSLVSNSSLEKI